jgi:hypothetical protein
MATLQRAFALKQRHDVAEGIAENLHLDVARPGDEFLDQDLVVAEGRARLALGAGHRFGELVDLADDAHAPAPAARRSLDQNGIADAIGGGFERGEALILAVIAGHHRHGGGLHQCLGRRFRAHQPDGLGRRPDEHQPSIRTGPREIGIFRQEAIARMHGLGAGGACRIDDRFDVEVAVLGRRRTYQQGFVGERDMQRIAVGVGEHRHGPKAHAFGRADDPARDLAAVGDQELVEAPGERHRHILKMPKRVGSGGGALSPAASASASTVRVSAGSMMPSSQMRALA